LTYAKSTESLKPQEQYKIIIHRNYSTEKTVLGIKDQKWFCQTEVAGTRLKKEAFLTTEKWKNLARQATGRPQCKESVSVIKLNDDKKSIKLCLSEPNVKDFISELAIYCGR
jgi:hypothetical protein